MKRLVYAVIIFSIIINLCVFAIASPDDDCGCDEELIDLARSTMNISGELFTPEVFYPPQSYTDVIAIFSSQKCKYCKQLIETTIPSIAKESSKNVYIHFFSLDKQENYERFAALLKAGQVATPSLPFVVGEGFMLNGREEVSKELPDFIREGSRSAVIYEPVPDKKKNNSSVALVQLKPFLVFGAGLADGINPCAFSTIIFLLSYLSLAKVKKRMLLQTGLLFSLGVFLLYFLVGIGIYQLFVTYLDEAFYWGGIVKKGVGWLVLVLGLLTLADILILLFTRRTDKTILKLPRSSKLAINYLIRTVTRTKYLLVLSFLLGFGISALELACTGQVYFPTIMYLIKEKTYMYQATCYLLLYNFAFIIPLIVVFFMVYTGLSTKKLDKALRDHMWVNKLLLAVVFFVFAYILLI